MLDGSESHPTIRAGLESHPTVLDRLESHPTREALFS